MSAQTRLVEVRQNVLKHNDMVARELRQSFHDAGVYVVSLVSSPGSGKTAFLEKTLTLLRPDYRVAALVGGHTDAKRYLVTADASYAACLSENSTATLVGQGGRMTGAEVGAFKARPEWTSLVDLRQADDAAKVADAPVRPPEAWRPVLEEVARTVRGRTLG